jgi:alpha-beta hydrolase superfamily lysophospholipase
MRGKLLDRAKAARCPALVLQADGDKVVVIKQTRKVYELLGSQDKTYKTYPGFSHDCEFEPARAVLDEDIAQWCLAHAPSNR